MIIDEALLCAAEEHAERLLATAAIDAEVPTMTLPTSAGIVLLSGWDVPALTAEIRRLWAIEAAARQVDTATKICKGYLYVEYADKLDVLHEALKRDTP